MAVSRPRHHPTRPRPPTVTNNSSWLPVALALAAVAIPGLVLWLLRHGEWWRRRRRARQTAAAAPTLAAANKRRAD